MTTVTKVFLVLLVIGAIALSTASITLTAQSRNWRQLADEYRLDAVAAAAEKVSAIAQADVVVQQLTDAQQASAQQIDSLRAELIDRQNELADLRTKLQRLEVEIATDKAALAKLTASLTVEQGRATKLDEQYRQQLARALDVEKRNIDLSDRVRELTAEVQVLENEGRMLKQQNAGLRDTLTKLREQFAVAPQLAEQVQVVQPTDQAAQPIAPPAVSPIRGKVLTVEGNVIGISVGESHGVRIGMAFVIYRGDESVGRLIVRDIDTQVAAGTLDKAFGKVQVGDMVIDEVTLMAQPP